MYSQCTLLSSLVTYIRDCEPARYWWQFLIEYFCSIIKPKAHSKSQLNASLANAVIIAEHLNYMKFIRSMRLGVVTIKSSPTAISYPVLLDCFKPYLFIYQCTYLEMIFKCHNLIIEGYKRCQLHQDLLVSSTQLQYSLRSLKISKTV